jgi:hypothetical protein
MNLCTTVQAEIKFNSDYDSPQKNESTQGNILGVRPDFSSGIVSSHALKQQNVDLHHFCYVGIDFSEHPKHNQCSILYGKKESYPGRAGNEEEIRPKKVEATYSTFF